MNTLSTMSDSDLRTAVKSVAVLYWLSRFYRSEDSAEILRLALSINAEWAWGRGYEVISAYRA